MEKHTQQPTSRTLPPCISPQTTCPNPTNPPMGPRPPVLPPNTPTPQTHQPKKHTLAPCSPRACASRGRRRWPSPRAARPTPSSSSSSSGSTRTRWPPRRPRPRWWVGGRDSVSREGRECVSPPSPLLSLSVGVSGDWKREYALLLSLSACTINPSNT